MDIYFIFWLSNFLKQLATVVKQMRIKKGKHSAFVGNYLLAADKYTFGTLMSISSSRKVYAVLTQNTLQCVCDHGNDRTC